MMCVLLAILIPSASGDDINFHHTSALPQTLISLLICVILTNAIYAIHLYSFSSTAAFHAPRHIACSYAFCALPASGSSVSLWSSSRHAIVNRGAQIQHEIASSPWLRGPKPRERYTELKHAARVSIVREHMPLACTHTHKHKWTRALSNTSTYMS